MDVADPTHNSSTNNWLRNIYLNKSLFRLTRHGMRYSPEQYLTAEQKGDHYDTDICG